jgi:hypothetical protein
MRHLFKGIGSSWWLSAALLVVLSLGMFFPWFVSGRVLAPLDIVSEGYLPWRGQVTHPTMHNHFVTDTVLHYIPYRMLAEQGLEQDGYVGWNPLLFGGTAQNANTMLINYDWSVLLHYFAPFWSVWTLGRMGQFLLAGMGMLIFLRSRGCAPGVAVLGSVAYMLNQQFVAWIYFNQVVAAFCWLPFLLWAIYRSLERSPRYLGAAACFLALALLGSTLQQMAFVLAALGCVYVGILIDGRTTGLVFRKTTVAFIVFGILGAGLVSFMLEPTIGAYFENEQTGHSRGGFLYPAGSLQPVLQAVASPLTIFPSWLGSTSSLDLWKVFKFDIFFIGFFGTVPMVLALFALFSRGVPSSAKLLVLAGVLIPLTPLVGFLYHRFNILWILGGCWACCAWLASASPDMLRRASRWIGILLGLASAVWLLASLGIWWWRDVLESALQAQVLAASSSSAFGLFEDWMRARATNLLSYLCIWNPWQIMMLGGAAISVWGLMRLEPNKGVWQFVAAAGVALQLSVFWWQWTTWSEPELIYKEPELARFLQQEVGTTGRLAMEPTLWAESMFPPNMLMPSGVAITGGYDAIQPFGMKSPSGRSWDFPGATHFLGEIADDGPEGWTEVWSDGEWHVLRNPEQAAGLVTTSGGEKQLSRDMFARPTLNTMKVRAPAGTTKLMLYSNWHRGWKWRDPVEKVWKPVTISDIKGVQVDFDQPLGAESVIDFRYSPSSPWWTMTITLLSLVGVVVVIFPKREKVT